MKWLIYCFGGKQLAIQKCLFYQWLYLLHLKHLGMFPKLQVVFLCFFLKRTKDPQARHCRLFNLVMVFRSSAVISSNSSRFSNRFPHNPPSPIWKTKALSLSKDERARKCRRERRTIHQKVFWNELLFLVKSKPYNKEKYHILQQWN